MRILVTGANGFLGNEVVNLLASIDVEVIALSTSSFKDYEETKNSSIRRITAAPDIWKQSLSKYSPDVAILCDWSGVDRNLRKLDSQFTNNMRWTELCSSLAECGVSKIVAFGSQAEISNNQESVDEGTPFAPRNEYGWAKKLAFESLSDLSLKAGISFVWGRIFSLYGKNMSKNSFLSEVATNLILERECSLSPCDQIWNFLHVADCAKAIWALASNRDSSGIYNLASTSSFSLRVVANFLAGLEGRDKCLKFGARGYSAQEVMVMTPSTIRLQNLGWSPEIDIWSGLKSLYLEIKKSQILKDSGNF